MSFLFSVLELIFYSPWTAVATLGVLVVGGFSLVLLADSDWRPKLPTMPKPRMPKLRRRRKPKRRHRKR
ncbi:hypothetical protein [Actinacidiphila sp. ITFR-21]|uniref:hypothetical protein n=1 Tax=Actinacidiphila sp. ITFR-21 TaxID=3075199 RepID=UPI00288AA0E3|nr:hypothetical protein [Streptomyces sp. ITFR-21]WNI17560.1 hypothetical protein RLT57_19920 [Streptomyces sp. ITFR-21]WNI17700.1 hypothetical protein RLT57_20635 [Streptomyces sp. ITFR-21]